jgi:hypothetical protein
MRVDDVASNICQVLPEEVLPLFLQRAPLEIVQVVVVPVRQGQASMYHATS